ncbi:MAG: hypothetical protein KDB80_02005, partial [Planctomycetes bacterium]|nr:hypothetical protein [Planctomycetota bacterium]
MPNAPSPLREAVLAARAECEQAWLADVPPEQARAVEAALAHPCWKRTTSVASHRFLFLGPERLVGGIPPESALQFDLAYLYLTDLFGRVPNPGGDRVTVYFKELWEFGGGVGGGKTIDIGRADPKARGTRVDTKLLYHELTHCVDDTRPVYRGFREGLADMGATFVDTELGNRGRARADSGLHFRAFQQDYLQRDLEYWRIPNYGPSAGFLLHFMTEYGKGDNGYRWELYRRFFRAYRECPVGDSRAQNIARAFGHHLVEVFGEAAFRDLQRFRWPLVDSDLEAIRLEHEAAHDRMAADAERFQSFVGSPIPRDILAGDLLLGRRPSLTDLERELGILEHWHVIGPFRKDRVGADGFVFPPEYEVDLEKRYPLRDNTATWRKPGPRPPVMRDDDGWLVFDYPYMDDTAMYALTHVTVPESIEAWAWVRADDDLTLFVEDRLVGKYRFASGPIGPWAPTRKNLPDAIRFPIQLRAGRNKILLKVRNGHGPSGCSLALSRRDGRPIEGLVSDDRPPERVSTRVDASDPKRWSKRIALHFRGGADARKLEAKVGKFTVQQKALVGASNDGAVEWRKYTVRPGFPKDSPSNLAWLKERITEDLDDFWLRVGFDAKDGPPKACVIFQGDGSRDALSGWTLVLEPDHGRGEFRIRIERYDRLVYESDWVAVNREEPTPLDLLYERERLTIRYGELEVLSQIPIRPIPDRTRIGIAHWGDRTRITELELRTPRRTK